MGTVGWRRGWWWRGLGGKRRMPTPNSLVSQPGSCDDSPTSRLWAALPFALRHVKAISFRVSDHCHLARLDSFGPLPSPYSPAADSARLQEHHPAPAIRPTSPRTCSCRSFVLANHKVVRYLRCRPTTRVRLCFLLRASLPASHMALA